MFNKKGKNMKLKFKILLITAMVVFIAACATQSLEQQIAVKEPGSWDFKSVSEGYVRIFDDQGKIGWFKFEYGQKHPCNQGFQKAIKTVAPGLVSYETDVGSKSFACDSKKRYVFRTDEQGNPYEGWVVVISDREKRNFADLSNTVKWWDAKDPSGKAKPTYILVK
jgi:hypothetical protein